MIVQMCLKKGTVNWGVGRRKTQQHTFQINKNRDLSATKRYYSSYNKIIPGRKISEMQGDKKKKIKQKIG